MWLRGVGCRSSSGLLRVGAFEAGASGVEERLRLLDPVGGHGLGSARGAGGGSAVYGAAAVAGCVVGGGHEAVPFIAYLAEDEISAFFARVTKGEEFSTR